MADIRIKDLATTATTTASDDFMAVDGSTNGTRKMNAAAPAFLTSVTTPSLTSPAATNLTLGLGTGGTALTLTSSTLAATFAGAVTASGSALVQSGTADPFINIKATADTYNPYLQFEGWNRSFFVGVRDTGGDGLFSIAATSALTSPLFSLAVVGGAATFSGAVTVSSTTAGSAGAGALVVTGGLATGDASYFGGAVTAAGTLRATNGNLYTYGESGDTTTGALFFNSAANNYIYGSGSQLAVYTAGALRATIASTGATFSGAVSITGNVGFYGQAATAKPTGVAVTAAAIHAALVTLNLIAA